RFAQPEISIGVFPPLASTILPFLVGPKIALELVLTGEPVTAERALELGMINRLVPEAQLEKTVSDLVGRINGHSGPVLTMAKKRCRRRQTCLVGLCCWTMELSSVWEIREQLGQATFPNGDFCSSYFAAGDGALPCSKCSCFFSRLPGLP